MRKHISGPRKRSQSAPAVLRLPAKKVKCKQWTDTQMKPALEAVASGSSVNRAAVDHAWCASNNVETQTGRTGAAWREARS